MRITLNLATRPFADLGPAIKRLRIAMGVMAGLCVAFGIGLHFFHSKAEVARASQRTLDSKIAAISRERQQYIDMMHQPPNAALLTQVGELNQLFDEKAFSWTLALEDLETVLPGGVQASSLEPVRAKDGIITLHLRVIGPRDREVKLVENLEHSKRFLSPRIVGEVVEQSEGQNQQRVEPVSASNRFNFDLLAEYNPAAPNELAAQRKAAPAPKSAGANHPLTPLHKAPAAGPGRALGRTPGLAPGLAPAPAMRPGRVPFTGISRPPVVTPKPTPSRVAPPAANAAPANPPVANPGGPQ
jgi:type IV pilus assembly protein PilN